MSGIAAAYAVHAAGHPARPALVFDDQLLTWADLSRVVDEIAGAIAARTPPDGAVALALPQSLALALLFLGCARAGREAQIVSHDWPSAALADILGALRPDLIIADRALSPDALVLPRSLPPQDLAGTILDGRALSHLADVHDDLLFYCGLTSGSTGRPRAYRRTHRSWLQSFRADAVEFGLSADDIILAPGSLTHSLFLYALARGLHIGATVVLAGRFHPPDVLAALVRHRASVLYAVPSQVQLITDAARQRGATPIATLRWLLVTGAAWFARNDPNLRTLFPDACFVEFYGASETSFIALARDGEAVPQGSVGRAFAGVRLRVRDPATRMDLPPGESGLIFSQSAMQFAGYADGLGEGAMRHGDELSVGDIGYLDADGFLFLTGRQRRMIVTAGKNLFPEEVEAALRAHPLVAEAAVIGVRDALRGERLVAFVRPRDDRAPTRRDVIGHLRAMLPLFKVPRLYAQLNDWPLTHSAKTDYAALERLWHGGDARMLT